MDLVLTYSEALDFIINLDLADLSHENHEAFIYEARKILCSYLANGKPDAEGVITFSPEENYKFEQVGRDCSFWIEKPGLFRPAEAFIEQEKYSSDGIRAYMENKSLMDRLNTPAGTPDKKQPAETTEAAGHEAGNKACYKEIGSAWGAGKYSRNPGSPGSPAWRRRGCTAKPGAR